MLRHLLAVAVAGIVSMPRQPAFAQVKPVVAVGQPTQLAGVVEQLLGYRGELALDAGQVHRLEALAADLRRQESDWYFAAVRRMSSKPWIHGRYIGTAEEARAAAFAILRPDQRQRATELLRASSGRGQS